MPQTHEAQKRVQSHVGFGGIRLRELCADCERRCKVKVGEDLKEDHQRLSVSDCVNVVLVLVLLLGCDAPTSQRRWTTDSIRL